jgi:hypothetical protein
MKVIWPGTLTERAWSGLSQKAQLWLKFIHATRAYFVMLTSALVAVFENFTMRTSHNGVRLINGGFAGTKHLDSWRAFTHLAVRRNAKSSWRLTSIRLGTPAVKQLDNK